MKKYMFVLAVIVMFVTAVSCSQPVPPKPLQLYSLSDMSSYSDTMKAALGELNKELMTGDMDPKNVPDVLAVRVSDCHENWQAAAVARTILADKTVIIDNPSIREMSLLALAINYLFEDVEEAGDDFNPDDYPDIPDLLELYNKYNADETQCLQTLFSTTEAFEDDWVEHMDDRPFAALGIRKRQTYCLYDINDTLFQQSESSEDDELDNASSVMTADSVIGRGNDDILQQAAAAKFARWVETGIVGQFPLSVLSRESSGNGKISEKDKAVFKDIAPGSLNDLIAANSYYHTFYAGTSYAGGARDLIEVVNEVWTACDLANQQDYYLVHTRTSANNDQLGCYTDWKKYGRLGPYFGTYKLNQSIIKDSAKQTILNESPPTSTGSTTFTTGTSFNIGGSIGVTPAGPSLGVTAGGTFSKSSTTSIPDITVTHNVSDNESLWEFKGRNPYYGGDFHVPDLILRNRASFDTYTVYKIKSDYCYSDSKRNCVRLYTRPYIRNTTKISEGKGDKHIDHMLNTWIPLYDYVPKPSHCKERYIMSFTPPAGLDSAKIDAQHQILKSYFPTWNNSTDYGAVWEDQLDSTAGSIFSSTMDLFKANKEVLKERGFSGTYKFYIKRASASAGNNVKECSIDF